MGKNKAKVNIYLFGFVYPREFGDNKVQKPNIFLKVGAKWVQVVGVRAYLLACPLVAGVQALCGCPLLSWCVPLL